MIGAVTPDWAATQALANAVAEVPVINVVEPQVSRQSPA